MTEIREYRKASQCERGGRLRRCRRPLAGQCQYCALGFCAQHGAIHADGQQICTANACQQKRRDLERHLRFKAEALQRNRAGGCGLPGCSARPARSCERCGRSFCLPHLVEVVVNVVRGSERAVAVVRLCRHCQARAALWANQ